MTGRLSRDERVAAGLAVPALRPVPAPGLVVTVWHPDSIHKGTEGAAEALAAIRPDVVQLHTQPTPDDARAVARVGALVPGARVWIGAPADTLARDPRDAPVRATQWAQQALALGAECLILNGEAAWKDAPAGLARDVIAACRAAAPTLTLGWTGFDHPRYHRLPWGEILGAAGVDLHLPQVYAAPGGDAVASRQGAATRWRSAAAQWDALGSVLAPHRLGGARCVPYLQAHHVALAGTCMLLDRAPLASAWALPTRSDAEGVRALRVDAELRRRVGHAPGRVARWQTRAGLDADGIVGKDTLAALGLA